MAILLEIIFVIAAIIAIISFFTPNKEESKEQPPRVGLYECVIKIGKTDYTIKTEVQLVRDYGDNDVHVVHNKIFGMPKDLSEVGVEILLTEHTLISKEDVKWEI